MKIGSLFLNFRRLGIFIAIGVVLVLVMNFNTRLGEFYRLENQVATMRAQATGVMVTQEALQVQDALATSPAAVETYARGEAHLALTDDKVIIVLPVPGSTPQPTAIPTPAVNDLTPWEVWMLFIFGK